MHITHETSSGVDSLQLPLPVCPQKFLAFESEQFARNDHTKYTAGLQDEFRTDTDRTYRASLVEVLHSLFQGCVAQAQGKLEGVFRYLSPSVQVRYELAPLASNRLLIKLWACSHDPRFSDNLLNEYLQTLLSNFNFILG